MEEPVGRCSRCGAQICCEGGFLKGIVLDHQHLICFVCAERQQQETKKPGDLGK